MKILAVQIFNLNSLKGTFTIRFDQPPIQTSGLFAITGPTGSGKTTILDAVCMALYGQTPRLGSGTSLEDIITKHQREAYAMVEFENNGQQYRATFSFEHKRINLNKTWELAELPSGRIVSGHKITETGKLIEEKTGLPYNQFIRSVLLSQGETSKFLFAKESERSELLEKITDDYQYSQISKFVYKYNQLQKEKLNELERRKEELALLSDDERNEYQAELAQFEKKNTELKLLEKKFKEEIDLFNRVNELTKNITQQKERLQYLTNEKEKNKESFNKLILHEKALPFQLPISRIENEQKEIDTLNEKIQKKKIEIEEVFKSVNQYRSENDLAEQNYKLAKNQLQQLKSLVDIVNPLDWEIKVLEEKEESEKETLDDLQIQISKLENQVNSGEEILTAKNAELEKVSIWIKDNQHFENVRKTLAEYTVLLNQYNGRKNETGIYKEQIEPLLETVRKHPHVLEESLVKIADAKKKAEAIQEKVQQLKQENTIILEDDNLDEIQFTAVELPGIIQNWNEVKQLAEQYKQLQEEKEIIIEKKNETEAGLEIAANLLDEQKSKLFQEMKYLSTLDELVRLKKDILNYESERALLTDGEPCPLCGSTSHPYAEHLEIQLTDEDLENFNNQKEMVVFVQDNIKETEKKISLLNYDLEKQTERIALADEKSKKLVDKYNSYKKEIEIDKLSDIEHKIDTLNKERDEINLRLNKINSNLNEIALLEKDETGFHQLINQLNINRINLENNLKIDQNNLDHLYKLQENTAKEMNRIADEIQELIDYLDLKFSDEKAVEIQLELEKNEKYFQLAQEKKNKLQNELHTLNFETENLKKILEEKENLLEKQNIKYSDILKDLNANKEKRMGLFGERTVDIEISKHELKYAQSEENLHLLKDKLSKSENEIAIIENSIQQMEQDISSRKVSLHEHSEELSFRLVENGIFSIDQVKVYILKESEFKEIDSHKKQLTEDILRVENTIENLEEEHAAKEMRIHPNFDLEKTIEEIEKLSDEQAINNQRIGQIKLSLENNDLALESHKNLQDQLQKQFEYSQKWVQLNSLIGSADGNNFRKFAQGITLEILINLANRHLSRFSNRYLMNKKQGSDLEIDVVDLYQAESIRPIKTLSGGESFLFSLALALGLSELSGNKTKIESLFIDEGFGTLDPDTLDTALLALESLQTDNKTIGIISHVGMLQERIPTQVKLEKRTGGYSTLRIVE